MRRFPMLLLSLSLTLSLIGAQGLFAQDAKKAEAKPADAKPEAKPADTKPADAPAAKPADAPAAKEEPKKEEPPKPIPPEVQKKRDAVWKAIAELMVDSEDAGLVDTSIKPPPVFDILVTGRATDATALKNHQGVSPEVFAAWFVGYGKSELNINPENDVRIMQPSQGLKTLFDERSAILTREMEAIRKAKAAAEPKKEEPKKEEAKKEEPKKEEPKKEEPKKEEPKKEEPKKEEPAKK